MVGARGEGDGEMRAKDEKERIKDDGKEEAEDSFHIIHITFTSLPFFSPLSDDLFTSYV